MIPGLVFRLTVRELAGQRRLVLVSALAMMPLLAGALFMLGGQEGDRMEFAVNALVRGIVGAGILPVIAAVLGTSALGNEFEDETAIYLLARPIDRWQVVLAKACAAFVLIAIVVIPPALGGLMLSLEAVDRDRVVLGAGLAFTSGTVLYALAFVALSVYTSRALIAGLVYVFLWEGVITSLFSGTRWLSIRQYMLGIFEGVAGETIPFEARLGGASALVAALFVAALAFLLATRGLERWEIRGPG